MAEETARPRLEPSAAYRAFQETRFFGSLDGLRAISILGVIWLHTWIGTPQFALLEKMPILRSGRSGVEVFFTISGFLITTLLLREADKRGTVSLKDFYIRRALRIWPIYYAVLTLYIVLVFVTERHTERGHAFFHYLPGYLTYTYTWFANWAAVAPNFNFAWSLSTEEQFYFFWPFVIRLWRGSRAMAVMGAIVALRIVAGYGAFNRLVPETSLLMRMILSISVPICLGAILAILLHYPRTFKWIFRLTGSRIAAPASLVLLALCLIPDDVNFPPFWLALSLLVAACVIREDNGLAPALRLRGLAYIGVLSYGMYLYNTLIVKITRPTLGHIGIQHPVAVFPFVLAITVFVSWLSYRYIESRFLALKSRFSRLPSPASKSAPIKIAGADPHVRVHP